MGVITLEEIEKIKSLPGKAIGSSIKEDFSFVEKKEGKEGLEKLEKELSEMGVPIVFDEIKNLQWYPWYHSFLTLFTVRRLFNWSDDDFRENGKFSAKTSALIKFFIKRMTSAKKLLEVAGNYWNKYYSIGELNTEKLDEENKNILISVSGFIGHDPFCFCLEGYIWQFLSYVLPEGTLKVEEVECPLKGKEKHLFKVTW